MTTSAYKIMPSVLQLRMDEAIAALKGKPMLPTFVAQTDKLVRASHGNYLRFGPYWYAVKRILRKHGHDYGKHEIKWLADEYTAKGTRGIVDQESTLLAAWEYANGNVLSPDSDIEIDGVAWNIGDDDMRW